MVDDFETHPIGTAAELERLRQEIATLLTPAYEHEVIVGDCDELRVFNLRMTLRPGESIVLRRKIERG